eukprot:6210090-Pleurochrysis_carterae.AAC.2
MAHRVIGHSHSHSLSHTQARTNTCVKLHEALRPVRKQLTEREHPRTTHCVARAPSLPRSGRTWNKGIVLSSAAAWTTLGGRVRPGGVRAQRWCELGISRRTETRCEVQTR